MESNNLLQRELKKVKQELASYKVELEQTRGYLQCILQNSEDMLFATEVGGMLISFSKGGEKVLGHTWEELIGRQVKELAVDPSLFEELLTTSRQDGSFVQLDFPFRHKDGSTVYCDVSLINLLNRDGLRVGTVGICRDITQWKKIQEDLVQIDRLAEIGRIASGVAHEINNPLAIISEASGWAGTVIGDADGLNSEDRQELEKATKDISAQTRRCRTITHQLLGFVRDSELSKSEVDVHELLNQTISFLGPELKHSSIKIDTAFTQEALHIHSEPRLLEQIFVNLITNAIHAVRERYGDEGHIKIKTVKTGSEVEISFADNGNGIPPENRQKIFELFYSTKPPGKGTGLGLPICQNIARKLGGEISFQSKVGVGTIFTLQIPSC